MLIPPQASFPAFSHPFRLLLPVNDLLTAFCDTFNSQIARRTCFYKRSSLVKHGIIKVTPTSWTHSTTLDLVDNYVDMDRRILDKIVGLDTEISELMEASHLYTPNVSMSNVVLPKDIKDSVISTISTFDKYKKYRRDAGLDDILSYGSGMVLLFCGPSGTGKRRFSAVVCVGYRSVTSSRQNHARECCW